jgi:hypothetical protein
MPPLGHTSPVARSGIVARAVELSAHWLLTDGAVPEFVATVRKAKWRGTQCIPDNLAEAISGFPPLDLACICLPDGPGIAAALAVASSDATARIAVHVSREDILVDHLSRMRKGLRHMIVPFGATALRALTPVKYP